MPGAAFGGTPFSRTVKLWLEHDHAAVPLAQVGADFVIASGGPDVPPDSLVTIVVSIDGEEQRHPYRLLGGLTGKGSRSGTVYVP